jgi:hypothetical protein
MKRKKSRTSQTLLSKHFQWRAKLLGALTEFSLARAGSCAAALALVQASLKEMAALVGSDDAACVELVGRVLEGFFHACRWCEAQQAAASDAPAHLTAAHTNATVGLELARQLPATDFRNAASIALTELKSLNDVAVLPAIASRIALIPVPPFIVKADEIRTVPGSEQKASAPVAKRDVPAVVRVMLTVDQRPWASPQRLQPGVVYDSAVVVTIPDWPEGMDQLILDYSTTLPESSWEITPFVIDKTDDVPAEIRRQGHVRFTGVQSVFSEPVSIQLRARFVARADAAKSKLATIVGYHRLRVRVRDGASDPMSKYPAIDPVMSDLAEKVRDVPGVAPAHWEDFVHALSAIGNILGNTANEAAYRTGEKITEAEFHRRLLHDMRVLLGPDVKDGTHQAAGITDLQYRTVTIELKVETKISERAEIFDRYEGQAVQYGSGIGSQLGILCVLDLTEKDVPPAPPQNSIKLLKPPVHGFPNGDAQYPAYLAALVIDGNLRSPSSYSR